MVSASSSLGLPPGSSPGLALGAGGLFPVGTHLFFDHQFFPRIRGVAARHLSGCEPGVWSYPVIAATTRPARSRAPCAATLGWEHQFETGQPVLSRGSRWHPGIIGDLSWDTASSVIGSRPTTA